MPTPLIGVTTYIQKNKYGYPVAAVMSKYVEAVVEAGGVPLLVPVGLNDEHVEEIVTRVDGFLFTGGGDLSPGLYNGTTHPALVDVDDARDRLEFFLVKTAVHQGVPFLGICRGLQVVNVALGGTLFSHIPGQFPGAIKHNYDSGTERELLAHSVSLTPGTRLRRISSQDILEVNSLHHQGIKELASGIMASATAPDGLIEALEVPGHSFGCAVQWHPEWLTSQPAALALFRAFVVASAASMGRGNKGTI